MDYFSDQGSELHCEDLPISQIAQEVKTPFYLYSHKTLVRHLRVFDTAFQDLPHLICFAVKANANLAILNTLALQGSGFDVVSGGELYRALRAGGDPQKIVYAGVGKDREELSYALTSGILMFNVESSQELRAIDEVAASEGRKAPVALRVNPDVDPHTHPYISTGLKKNKFGFDLQSALNEYRQAQTLKHVEIVGIHSHIGSQITETGPFEDAFRKLLSFVKELKAEGIPLRYLDLGGGLGITYRDEEPPSPQELARVLSHVFPSAERSEFTFIFEPGRVIVGNAGILVTRVLYLKQGTEKNFVIVDAGMNDLIRPSLYNSYHHIRPVKCSSDSKQDCLVADIVGPICESGDFLAKDRSLQHLAPGDLLAVMGAGAYGFTMSSNYNARPRVAEVLVRGSEYWVIRRRESYEDLIRGEDIPSWQ